MTEKNNNLFSMVPGGKMPPVDLSEAVPKTCSKCGGALFVKVFRMGLISALAPKNQLRRDVPVEYPTYVCVNCNTELFAKPQTPETKQ